MERGVLHPREVHSNPQEYISFLEDKNIPHVADSTRSPYRTYPAAQPEYLPATANGQETAPDFIGPLTEDMAEFGYTVVDEEGAEQVGGRAVVSTILGRVALLKQEAKDFIVSNGHGMQTSLAKQNATRLKKELVDLSNDYTGGQRYDGKLYVISGNHYAGTTAKTLAYGSLKSLATRLKRGWVGSMLPYASTNDPQSNHSLKICTSMLTLFCLLLTGTKLTRSTS